MSSFDDTINLIYSIRDKDMLKDFLFGVTTPSERKELTTRVEIVKRLLKEIPHQEIAGDLHVGVATVTRGSRELAKGRFKVLRKK
jgi:Trp operon repressor